MTAIDYTKRPSLTYQELLDTDSHEVPDVLRWVSPMPPSTDDVPVERYTSAEFHQVEVDKVWTKVWQMACREEDIPVVGDHITYDIVGRSILVVRSAENEIKAVHIVCPLRGRRVREHAGRSEKTAAQIVRETQPVRVVACHLAGRGQPCSRQHHGDDALGGHGEVPAERV